MLARFAALALTCAAVSVAAFRARQGVWPELSEAAVGWTLLAPIALPLSLAETLGWSAAPTARDTLPLLFAFWGAAGAFGYCVSRYRSRLAFGSLCALLLVASLRWHDMAVALLGL